MQNKKEILYYCGFVLTLLSTFFHVLALSTPHWLESFEESRSSFDRLGLWTACFHNFAYDMDYMGKTYDGCHWIYSYEYKPVFDWLNPGWLILVQVFMVLALILDVTLVAIMVLQTFFARFHVKDKAVSVLFNSIQMFTSATLIGISVSLFGVQARTSRQWLPRPDQNYLSWSFGLAVVGGFFAVFSSMCLFTDSQRRRFEAQDKQKKEKMMSYSMEASAPLRPVTNEKIDLDMY